jgi:hypothetical protein
MHGIWTAEQNLKMWENICLMHGIFSFLLLTDNWHFLRVYALVKKTVCFCNSDFGFIVGNLQRRSDKKAAKHHGFERLIPGVASMTL